MPKKEIQTSRYMPQLNYVSGRLQATLMGIMHRTLVFTKGIKDAEKRRGFIPQIEGINKKRDLNLSGSQAA